MRARARGQPWEGGHERKRRRHEGTLAEGSVRGGDRLGGRFYALAIGLAGLLIGLPIYVIATGHFNLWLTITGLFLGGSILVAAFPRRLRFEAPGVKVDHASQPRLIELIEEEARALDEDPPHEVYVTMEVNAAVLEAGGG
jgi:hypothetical protein